MDTLDVNIMDKSMRSVFVGNIPYEATEEKLKEIFGEVGQVLSFKLVFDRETGKPKGYGFCEYRDPETALSAMRNLNGYEIGGRNLRVDNACTEKSRMEMQSLLSQPAVENPYGDPVAPEKAPEAISKVVASLPPEQMFELMKQMKLCIQNNPSEAKYMLLQNPQLAYALLQGLVVMRILDADTACSMLHSHNLKPQLSLPNDKTIVGSVPINTIFLPQPVQAPVTPDFPILQPPTVPLAPMNLQAPVFTGQDVDFRSLDMRGPGDPRLSGSRFNSDQDMRTIPAAPLVQLPNLLPPPVSESIVKSDTRSDSLVRDPRIGNASGPGFDPRQARLQDPRQKTTPPIVNPTLVQPVRPPPQPPVMPPVLPPAMVPPVQQAQPGASPSLPNVGASDQEKAALIMQVLQLSDEQIAMLPPEQRNSILVLKDQIAKSTQR